jgi:hypothetical protein
MKLLLISRIFAVIVAIALPFVFEIFHIIFSTIPVFMEAYTLVCLFSYYIILRNEVNGKDCNLNDIEQGAKVEEVHLPPKSSQ